MKIFTQSVLDHCIYNSYNNRSLELEVVIYLQQLVVTREITVVQMVFLLLLKLPILHQFLMNNYFLILQVLQLQKC